MPKGEPEPSGISPFAPFAETCHFARAHLIQQALWFKPEGRCDHATIDLEPMCCDCDGHGQPRQKPFAAAMVLKWVAITALTAISASAFSA